MSQRLKSDVRRVERADSEQDREQSRRRDDEEVGSRRKHHQRSETNRHDNDRNMERSYHRDRVDQRKRRHRSDDGSVETHSRTNVGDVVKERSRHGRREDDDRHIHTDNRRPVNSTSDRDADSDHHYHSESERKNEEAEDEKYMKAKRSKVEDTLTTRTGGAYIPPARLKMMQVSQRLRSDSICDLFVLIHNCNCVTFVHVSQQC